MGDSMTLGILKRNFTAAGAGSAAHYVITQTDATHYVANASDPNLSPVSGTDINAIMQTCETNVITAYGANAGPCIDIRSYGASRPYFFASRHLCQGHGCVHRGTGDNVSVAHGATVLKQTNGTNLTPNAFNTNTFNNSEWRNLCLDGNQASNATACDGLVLTNDNHRVYDCGFINWSHTGIIMGSQMHASFIRACYSEFNGSGSAGGAFGLVNSYDNWIELFCSGNTSVSVVGNVTGTVANPTRANRLFLTFQDNAPVTGELYLDGSAGNETVYDNEIFIMGSNETTTTSKNCIVLNGAQKNRIFGIIRNFGQSANNTYSGVLLQAGGGINSTNNAIMLTISNNAANKLKYCIQEADSNQDSNEYTNGQLSGAATSQIFLQGPNSVMYDLASIVPIGKVTNPFDNVGLSLNAFNGAAAIPTASTNYKVAHRAIFITAANSSNANNAILIKDNSGNTIIGPVGTLANQYVPRGCVINWGAFTGVAGAVTVWSV